MNINMDRISLPLKKICKTDTARPKPGNRNCGTGTVGPEQWDRNCGTGTVGPGTEDRICEKQEPDREEGGR